VNVRRGEHRDWAFVQDLGARTLESSRVRDADAAALLLGYARLLEVVRAQPHVVLVAEDAGVPIGFIIVLTDLPDEVSLQPQAFVASMAVEPAHRRRGAARALLAAAEDEARAMGLPYISLMVTQTNAEASRLYESAGYGTERRLLCKEL
jgi:ribosomal protein S18 acetylase RimI-like enzyme